MKYVEMDAERWDYRFKEDFIRKHAGKIYSNIVVCGYHDLAEEYKKIIEKCDKKQSIEDIYNKD